MRVTPGLELYCEYALKLVFYIVVVGHGAVLSVGRNP